MADLAAQLRRAELWVPWLESALRVLMIVIGAWLVTRIAGLLCRLIDDPATRLSAPLFMLDAHIDGIKATVRGDIRDADHPVGKALVEELERRVREYEA